MDNEKVKKNKNSRLADAFGKIWAVALRWLFMIMLLAGAAYALFVWNKYIVNAEWSEEKKQSYVEEQSVFTFDQKAYQKASELVKLRQKMFEEPASGFSKDIFFPEGF